MMSKTIEARMGAFLAGMLLSFVVFLQTGYSTHLAFVDPHNCVCHLGPPCCFELCGKQKPRFFLARPSHSSVARC